MGRALRIICGVVLALSLAGSTSQEIEQNNNGQGWEAYNDRLSVSRALERERGGQNEELQQQNNPEDIQKRDVDAQEVMARSAIIQLLLTLVAIWLLKGTLDATKQTVKAVSISNRSAARMAKQSRRANDIADVSFKIQNRAYVYAREAHIIWDGEGAPRIEITISNAGPTPASHVTIHTHRIVREGSPAPFAKNIKRRCHHIENGRPQSIPVCEVDELCGDIRAGLLDCLRDRLRVAIVGNVESTTLYNERVIAPFDFRIVPSSDLKAQPMKAIESEKPAFEFLPLDSVGADSDGKEQT